MTSQSLSHAQGGLHRVIVCRSRHTPGRNAWRQFHDFRSGSRDDLRHRDRCGEPVDARLGRYGGR